MNPRRNAPEKTIGMLNLDSLVDIVSNSVGILIILAVFMALLSYIEHVPETTPETRVVDATEKILIPWAHYSQKSGLLFLLRDNRVIRLDRADYYRKLKKTLSGSNASPPRRLRFDTHSVVLETGSGHAHCIEFETRPGAGEWWHQFMRTNGMLDQTILNHRPEETYFFFWVAPDSFELFREVRETLWNRNFEVGWKPVNEDSPLRYCTGFAQSRSFRPQ